MSDSRSHGSRRRGQTGGPSVVRCRAVPCLVALACLSGLIFLAACSGPRETPSSHVLPASVAVTAAPEAARQTAVATPARPPAPAPTLPSIPTVTVLQEPPAPPPEAPPAPPVEAAALAAQPVDAPPPGPAEADGPEPVLAPTAPAADAPAPAPPATGLVGDATGADRIRQLVNAVRANAGLGPLRPAAALMESAQRQAGAMAEADVFTHTPPNCPPIESRVETAGYGDWTLLMEVLAAGPADPDTVVELWMASPPHRAILLDPAVTEFGIGHYYLTGSTYGHWWTMDMGTR